MVVWRVVKMVVKMVAWRAEMAAWRVVKMVASMAE